MTDRGAMVELENVSVRFPVDDGADSGHVTALTNVSIDIRRGETLSVVGESGCGKTTLARMLLGFVAPHSGVVRINGEDITRLPTAARKHALRKDTQIVFQDPQGSLDPRLRIWRIISEPMALRGKDAAACRARAAEIATLVGLDDGHLERFPHQLSGGQRQRVAIGRALAADPSFIILDEPTSALDVSVQAQILNLLLDLQQKLALTYLFISHDIGVVRHMSDRVAVMYLGQIVELGPASVVAQTPAHPYTRMLMASAPRLNEPFNVQAFANVGEPVSNRSPPTGCYFASRCPQAGDGCELPQTLVFADSNAVRCWRASDNKEPQG